MSVSLWFDIFFDDTVDDGKFSKDLTRFFEKNGLLIRNFRESPPLKSDSDSTHHYKFFFDAYFPNNGGENYLSTRVYANRIHITLGSWMRKKYFLPLVRKLILFIGNNLKGILCGDEFAFDAYYRVLSAKGIDVASSTFIPEYSFDSSIKSNFWLVYISKNLHSKVDKKYFKNPKWKYENFENGTLIIEYETIFDERERDERGFVKQGQV